jgi:hypothetical protein
LPLKIFEAVLSGINSKWFQTLLDCKDVYGGDRFAILADKNGEVLLCLHQWGEDEHLTMIDPNITPGNGLILYFRTSKLNSVNAFVWLNVCPAADIRAETSQGSRN